MVHLEQHHQALLVRGTFYTLQECSSALPAPAESACNHEPQPDDPRPGLPQEELAAGTGGGRCGSAALQQAKEGKVHPFSELWDGIDD